MQRHPMNTEAIKQRFSEIYRELFSRSSVVCSTSRLFYWTGEYSECYGGPYLCHKLPIRTYVGLEPISKNQIKVGYYQVYNSSKKQFKNVIFDPTGEKNLADFLEKYLERNKLRRKNEPGFLINIVAELPFETGLGSISSFTSALASVIFLYYKLVRPDEIKAWSKYDTKNLTNNEKLKFKPIHNLAWKIETIVSNIYGSGGQSLTSLLPSGNPVLYFTEKRSGDVENHPWSRIPYDLGDNYDLIDQIRYWAFRPEEIIKPKRTAPWSIDYGLIFTGDSRITGNIVQGILAKKKHLDEAAEYITKKFSQTAGEVEPFFYTICQKEGGPGLWQRYLEMAATISVQILDRFKKLFDLGPGEESMRQFFRAINYNQNLLRIFNVSTPTIDYINAYISEKVKNISDYPNLVASKIVGAGKGGDMLFVVPYGTLRNEIDEMIEELRFKSKKDIFLDYANWLDGECEDGVIVEQSIDDEIYSNFVSQGALRIQHFDKQGLIHSDLLTLEDFVEKRKKSPFIIDAVEKDIYLNSKKLTSKDLHSACATVDILKILILHQGKSISNNALPQSSYTQDRNEFQSKIASPLIKAVKKHTNQKLNLIVMGGLVDFRVQLSPSNIDILIIDKKL